jgi:hypothetical protein
VLSTDNVLSLHEIASWRRFEAFDSVGRSRVTTVDVLEWRTVVVTAGDDAHEVFADKSRPADPDRLGWVR